MVRVDSGAVSGRLYSDAGAVRGMLGDSLSLVVQNCATISAGLIIAFTSGWELALVVLGLVPLLGLQGLIAGKRLSGFAKSAKVREIHALLLIHVSVNVVELSNCRLVESREAPRYEKSNPSCS